MSELVTTAIQLGQDGTATNNLTLISNIDGTFTIARGNIGATTQDLITIDASGNILFPADTNLLGKSFTSAEQTITSAGALTIPHGLGVTPSLFQCRVICKTIDVGYAVDDEVIINPAGDISTVNRGMSITMDATNIYIRFGSDASPLYLTNKTTGSSGAATTANWKLVVRAWK